ncbi:MAG TPA: MlaD family protein [Thermoleophilaceae bacterium]|nr:MlaD family protein [Thermoleophilaceae bacterium]
MTPLRAGAIGIVVLTVFVFFAFAKDIPFTKGYEMKAVFQNASALQLNSPVRIAGVDVGKVSKVEPLGDDSTLTEVTMKIDEKGLPIHRDARLKIRPRIFLEGNFFVDMRPGTPGSPDLPDGGTIGQSQTSAPVQLDQVLSTLKSSARQDLQKLLQGYGDAINGPPTAAEDATQDPDTQGQTAAESLNDSLGYAPDALRQSAIVNEAFLGTSPDDLARLVKGNQKVAAALVRSEGNLKDLITNFNTTTGALASRQEDLRATLRELPQVLKAANPALDELNASFPNTRAFAREILPAVRETPATIAASLPWIAQTRALVRPSELGGSIKLLQPAVSDLAKFTDGSIEFLPQADLFNRCALNNLLPTGDTVIRDGALSTGVSSQDEFFQSLVGLSGESQNFDGNGNYVRFQTGGGTSLQTSGPINGGDKLFANFVTPPLGTRPVRPSRTPPILRTSPCYKQKRPDLNSAKTGGGP